MKRIFFIMLALVLAIGLTLPPAVAASGTKIIHVRSQTLSEVQGNCPYITSWHFIINQIADESLKPASITVYWDNGAFEVVPLDTVQESKSVAHYTTTLNAGSRVTDATAVIYSAWDGKFNLSSIVCETCTGCLEVTKNLAIPVGCIPAVELDGTFVINVAGPGYSQDVKFEMVDGEIVSENPVRLCGLLPGTYTVSEKDIPEDWDAPDLPIDVEVKCDETAAVTVVNEYQGPCERLEVRKTVETSYIREHFWSIDKSVKTEKGYTQDGLPKIWLYVDGSGDETATWTIDVTYDGYKDSDFKVWGKITIYNDGDVDTIIIGVADELCGDPIPIDWGSIIVFPYTLGVGETLTGTYSVELDSKTPDDCFNVVTVTTNLNVYTAREKVGWGEPAEVNKTVQVFDNGKLLGEVTAPKSAKFTYDKYFKWEDYGADDCGSHRYDNTAKVIGDRGVLLDSDDATLLVNVQCYIYETAYAKGDGAICFTAGGFSNWGWTNPITAPGTYTWDLWAAAGQCDTSKGIKVGTVTVTYSNGSVTVKYDLFPYHRLQETHVYAGKDMFPQVKVGRRTVSTVAPGQYYIASSLNDSIWVIAHAKVGIPDPNFGP